MPITIGRRHFASVLASLNRLPCWLASTPFALAILVVTALTILVLVLASIVGGLLTVASTAICRDGQ